MADAIEVEVVISPGLKNPVPMAPFLRTGMTSAVELVRAASERRVHPSGLSRRGQGKGYGPLASELRTNIFQAPDATVGWVGTPTYYARFLEFGTKAHVIAPKHGRQNRKDTGPGMIAFGDASAPIFRRRVKQVGIRARFWMRSAADEERAAVGNLFEEAVQQWARASQEAL